MYPCPGCQHRTIAFLRKWLSWPASPAKCNHCGASCCIATVDASGTLAAAAVFITLAGFAAVAAGAAYLLLLGLSLSFAFYFWRQHRAALIRVSEQEAAVAKRSGWLMFLAFVFPSLFS